MSFIFMRLCLQPLLILLMIEAVEYINYAAL